MRIAFAFLTSCLFIACSAPPKDVDAGEPDAGAPGDGGLDGFRVDYRYGNQIYGSELTIDAAGNVEQRERNCCPPLTRDAGVSTLTASEANELRQGLAACEGMSTVRSVVDGGAAGDLYGWFNLISTDGGTTTLRRETLEAGNVQAVYRNTCAALPQLIDFVNARVERDMPRDF